MKHRNARSYQLAPCPRPDKQAYRSKSEAKQAKISIARKFGKGDDRPDAYLCECGLWHLGRRA